MSEAPRNGLKRTRIAASRRRFRSCSPSSPSSRASARSIYGCGRKKYCCRLCATAPNPPCHMWTAPLASVFSRRFERVGGLRSYVRPHMRALASSYFILNLLGFRHCGAVGRLTKAELPSTQVFPANLTSGGTESPPRSRIRDGRAPGGRRLSLRRCEGTRPDNGDAPSDSCARAVVRLGL